MTLLALSVSVSSYRPGGSCPLFLSSWLSARLVLHKMWSGGAEADDVAVSTGVNIMSLSTTSTVSVSPKRSEVSLRLIDGSNLCSCNVCLLHTFVSGCPADV